MHDLFYLAFRIITLVLCILPADVLTGQILGWMKGLEPGIHVSLNFKKLRTIVQLLLQLRDKCLVTLFGLNYQLALLIESIHYIIIDCFYSGIALTWLKFTLLAAHCMSCWILLGDYDLAIYHQEINQKHNVSDDLLICDHTQLENRRIYYNEACYTALIFLKRYIIPALIPLTKILEERFEFKE